MTQPHYLDETQIAEFARDGFLIVRGMFPADEMARIAAWTDEVVAMPEVPGRHMVYYEDSVTEPGRRVLSRIENFAPFHAGFERLLTDSKVTRCVADLFAAEPVLFKEKINFKLPGGNGFTPHQDVQAGWDAYAPLHITMLLAIDAADERNGCLELAAGAHRRGLLGEMWKPLADSIDGVDYRPCPTAPGDAVFFDSYAPHRSGPNLSDRQRRVLYITWNAAAAGDHRARYYADKRASYPPDCEREPGRRYEFRV